MRFPIVVGTDLSAASDDALIQAEARATRDRVPLTVVHAAPRRLWVASEADDDLSQTARRIRDHVMALTGRADHEFEVVVERGPAHLVLPEVAQARQALLVVGSHMERGIGHALLRDVAERVVGRSGPVLATRPAVGSQRIMVAVDSPLKDTLTLDAGIEEARCCGGTLMVLHCVHMGFIESITVDLINGGAYAKRPLGQRSLVVEARRVLAAELRRRGLDEIAELHVIEGPPQILVPEIALRCEVALVVVGSAHYPASPSHVAAAVLRHAPCSVLVVDTDEPPAQQSGARHAVAS